MRRKNRHIISDRDRNANANSNASTHNHLRAHPYVNLDPYSYHNIHPNNDKYAATAFDDARVVAGEGAGISSIYIRRWRLYLSLASRIYSICGWKLVCYELPKNSGANLLQTIVSKRNLSAPQHIRSDWLSRLRYIKLRCPERKSRHFRRRRRNNFSERVETE